jgi:hypothetical protein
LILIEVTARRFYKLSTKKVIGAAFPRKLPFYYMEESLLPHTKEVTHHYFMLANEFIRIPWTWGKQMEAPQSFCFIFYISECCSASGEVVCLRMPEKNRTYAVVIGSICPSTMVHLCGSRYPENRTVRP